MVVDGPLVSIIIPCINAAAFVREAIESGLAQTYPNFEVIVVDDGSTDDSLGIIRFFEERIRVLAQTNQGGSAARNTGLQAANREFVQFLDADDVLYPDKMLRQLTQAMPLSSTLVFCDAEYLHSPTSHSHHLRTDDLTDAVTFMLNGGLQTSAPPSSQILVTGCWRIQKRSAVFTGARSAPSNCRSRHHVPKTAGSVVWCAAGCRQCLIERREGSSAAPTNRGTCFRIAGKPRRVG